MKTPSTLKVDSIQFLRAVAVVLVVYVHILDSSVFANPQQKNFYYLFANGWRHLLPRDICCNFMAGVVPRVGGKCETERNYTQQTNSYYIFYHLGS